MVSTRAEGNTSEIHVPRASRSRTWRALGPGCVVAVLATGTRKGAGRERRSCLQGLSRGGRGGGVALCDPSFFPPRRVPAHNPEHAFEYRQDICIFSARFVTSPGSISITALTAQGSADPTRPLSALVLPRLPHLPTVHRAWRCASPVNRGPKNAQREPQPPLVLPSFRISYTLSPVRSDLNPHADPRRSAPPVTFVSSLCGSINKPCGAPPHRSVPGCRPSSRDPFVPRPLEGHREITPILSWGRFSK